MEIDRSIPFYNMILRCNRVEKEPISLPDGYCFQTYRKGFDDAWAEAEWELGDFDSRSEAKSYFLETYGKEPQELSERGVFVVDRDQRVVGSCIAWHDLRQGERAASLHWLFVSPAHRNKGIGRALCRKTMEIFLQKGEVPVYIHTQPWSWKAILLYVSLGFRVQELDTFSHYINQYAEAMDVLRKLLPEERYLQIKNASSR